MIYMSTKRAFVLIECEICKARLEVIDQSPDAARTIAAREVGYGFIRRNGVIEAYCIQHLSDMPSADRFNHPPLKGETR